nr:ALPV-012 [Albatrosspox virus]UNS14512.1 ALPV-348 [Albatrosspox virus]
MNMAVININGNTFLKTNLKYCLQATEVIVLAK